MSWELVGGKDYDMTDDGSGEMSDKINHTKGPWKSIDKNEDVESFGESDETYEFTIITDENYPWYICHVASGQPGGDGDDAALLSLAPTAPHFCEDPKCPGNINRQKLGLFHEMIEFIKRECVICKVEHPMREECHERRCSSCKRNEWLTRASALQEVGK